jgi:hypothetical protein
MTLKFCFVIGWRQEHCIRWVFLGQTVEWTTDDEEDRAQDDKKEDEEDLVFTFGTTTFSLRCGSRSVPAVPGSAVGIGARGIKL